VHGKFQKQYLRTSGLEPSSKYEIIDGKRVLYNIWDIPGHDSFERVHNTIFRNAHAAMVFFDLTDRSTFESIEKLIHVSRDVNPDVLLVIIGTKTDLVDLRQVTEEEACTKAYNHMALEYIETSLVTGDKMTDVFRIIGKELVRMRRNLEI
jgi:small GTP-binding protein